MRSHVFACVDIAKVFFVKLIFFTTNHKPYQDIYMYHKYTHFKIYAKKNNDISFVF